jgi:Zn-dependent metalloprotease
MKLFLTTAFVIIAITTFSQKLSDFKKEESWYDFKNLKSQKIKLSDFTRNYKSELTLSNQEQLLEKRNEKDNTGRTHIFYNHSLGGVEIEYSELILHSTSDNVYTEIVNDKLIKKIVNQVATVSEIAALKQVLYSFPSNKYAWQDAAAEEELKEEMKNQAATYYPKGILIYAKDKSKFQQKENYRLCYKFMVYSLKPFFKKDIYVDAVTGKIFKEMDLLINCNNPATATTLYNGNQQIITDWKAWPWNRFILIDCANRNIHTKYGSGANPEASSSSTTWGTNDQAATSAHWAAERTWDLFRDVYSRNGTNNANREVKTLVDFTGLIDNAGYDYSGGGNDKIRVGVTSIGNRTLASLDIMGHEITHGLTRATSGLVYQNESGALNESFSDIFGFLTERRTQPANFDWLIAEDPFFDNPTFIRNMQNPNLSGIAQPIIYQGNNWEFGQVDNGGVHRNSGVQNRWFFLLSNGGFQNGIAVNGIGIDNAARIAFNTLTVYLGQNSNYNDARNASINATLALFGPCSNQVIAVTNAWAAVGVGVVANPNCMTLSPNSIVICSDLPGQSANFPIVITPNIAPATGIVTWNVPLGYTFTISGNQLTIIDGPLEGDGTDCILATLTSPLGNPVSTCFTYIIQQCNYYPFASVSNQNKSDVIIQEGSSKNIFKVYPNPANAELFIFSKEKGILTISDMNGRKLLGKQLMSENTSIDISSFKTGMYIVQVITESKTFSKKIMVKQ